MHESVRLVIFEAPFCGYSIISGQTGFATTVANGRQAIVLDKPEAEHMHTIMKKLLDNDSLRKNMFRTARKLTIQLKCDSYPHHFHDVLATVLHRQAVA